MRWTRGREAAGRGIGQLFRQVLTAAALLGLGAGSSASAGTVDVRWDAVSASDLAGYKVYWGTTPGSHSNVKDVGNTTSTQLSGLSDCQLTYITVRAYDSGGLESSADSNSVKGYPRPVVTSVSPTSIKQGQTLTFTITGTNYDQGVNGDPNRPRSTLQLSNTGLTITSYTVNACGTITMTVQASATAPLGFSSLTVKNPDLTNADPNGKPWVFVTKDNAIEVRSNADTTAPTVSSTNPAAGATNVAATVNPVVNFSESMLAASITATTVRLLDSAGAAVPQAAGSPTLSGATVTIRPAAALTAGKQYHIDVAGGSSGVKDLAGNAMAANYTQSPAFTIATDGGSTGTPEVTSFSPAAGEQNVSVTLSQATVTFDKDVSALGTLLSRAELQKRFKVTSGKHTLAQQPTSPIFTNGGKTVVIQLAEALVAGGSYTTNANLAGGSLKTTLTNGGRPDLYAGKSWKTSPPWVVEPPIEGASYREPATGDSGTLVTGPSLSADVNSGVPVNSEFRVTFQANLVPASVNTTTFKIQNSKKKTVILAVNPAIENGKTVVLRPSMPLEPGKTYKIVVKTGKAGVMMITPTGNATAKGKQLIPFSTEVSAASLGETLSIGVEPQVQQQSPEEQP